MNNLWNAYAIEIGEAVESPFLNRFNVYQDGTTPLFRDADGVLWGMSGHSHMGEIAMFRGKSLSDMEKAYPIEIAFSVGNADGAFDGVRYPEGVLPRGSIWPFGLYICPRTRRFFCFFHNETGWNGQGRAYDAFGPCETPAFDSDFRHVGMMHSDDEGRHWFFDRWVLTAHTPCFTECYNPGAGVAVGQPFGSILLGSGDFSCFCDFENGYIYLLYTIIGVNMKSRRWESCDAYIARTPMRCDGLMGDFVKYCDGAFCEAGNLGRETPIVKGAWHPRMVRSELHGLYVMTASRLTAGGELPFVDDVMQIRLSRDMLRWSDPVEIGKNGAPFGNHYVAMVPHGDTGSPFTVEGAEFSFLTNHNGTDVLRYPSKWVKKTI